MDTKRYRVSVGTRNCVIDRAQLEERAKKVGYTSFQLEELSDTELEKLVLFKELKDY